MNLFKKGKGKEAKPKPPIQDKPRETELVVDEKDGHACAYMAMAVERTGRKRAMAMLSVSLIANLILLLGFCMVFYWGVLHRRDIYFATTPDGRIQEIVPLDQPYVSTAGVSNWVAQAVTETYSLDFRNYKKTLAKVRGYYSPDAWRELEQQITPLIESIIKERLILYAVADEAPRLLGEGMFTSTKYAWKLEFPMTLTHQLNDRTETFRWTVQTLVGRVNVAEKVDGVEILQFIIVPRR